MYRKGWYTMKSTALRCWLLLLLAILLEILGTAVMKFFTAHGYIAGYAVMIVCIALAYVALSKAVVIIPISTAYAIWEGLGLIGTAVVAWLIFHEQMEPLKVLAFGIILAGMIMIKKGTTTYEKGEDTHVA